MKRDIKSENIERKHNDIFKDFNKMFVQGFRIDVIYEKLEKKYYYDKGTIYRVILDKKFALPDSKKTKGET
ncbi:MAG TPA: hypothetical protein VHE59_10485 [Mucilaginibacter sp.]|nr:hypothetical protein [Mucilaginibacter sp.]